MCINCQHELFHRELHYNELFHRELHYNELFHRELHYKIQTNCKTTTFKSVSSVYVCLQAWNPVAL